MEAMQSTETKLLPSHSLSLESPPSPLLSLVMIKKSAAESAAVTSAAKRTIKTTPLSLSRTLVDRHPTAVSSVRDSARRRCRTLAPAVVSIASTRPALAFDSKGYNICVARVVGELDTNITVFVCRGCSSQEPACSGVELPKQSKSFTVCIQNFV